MDLECLAEKQVQYQIPLKHQRYVIAPGLLGCRMPIEWNTLQTSGASCRNGRSQLGLPVIHCCNSDLLKRAAASKYN